MNTKHLSIKTWSEDDRPREKLIAKGAKSLSNAELIAIMLGSGNRSQSAVSLAQEILRYYNNNLSVIATLDIEDLTKFKGVGPAKAASIITTNEWMRRCKAIGPVPISKIQSSQNAYTLVAPHLLDLAHEEFYILLLKRNNEVIQIKNISKGGVSGTIADSKIIFKYCVQHLASGLILAHNHPSGNLQPSEADRQLTKKIKLAANSLDIKLLDHIIVGGSSYFSFADEGYL